MGGRRALMYLYPRLPSSAALEILHEQADLTPEERSAFASVRSPSAVFATTGGTTVPGGRLWALRTAVMDVARTAGFPANTTSRSAREFDQSCAGTLHRLMGIVPADAGDPRVWTFLTCVLLPEVTPWRFQGAPEERYLSRIRNTLGRLWWRAEILGSSNTDPPARFGEDALVQVMERTSLGGDPRVAKSLCQSAIVYAERSGLSLSDLMRDATKRVVRLNAFVSLSVLSQQALSDTIEECFSASAYALHDIAPGVPQDE
jgi:hypothetical protein